jgi:hypothetical protein
MPNVTYMPTPDEVMKSLKEHIEKSDFMMLVAVTDPNDPEWRGGDHINFSLSNTPKGWILQGSNGQKIKLTAKQIEPKEKKPEPVIETPPQIQTFPLTPPTE